MRNCLKFGMYTQFEHTDFHADFHADFHVFWLQLCVYSMLPAEVLEYTVSKKAAFIFKAYQSVYSVCYA